MAIKIFDGEAWREASEIRVFNGALWAVPQSMKQFDGEKWVQVWPSGGSSDEIAALWISPQPGEDTIVDRLYALDVSTVGSVTLNSATGHIVFPGTSKAYVAAGGVGNFNFLFDGSSEWTVEFIMAVTEYRSSPIIGVMPEDEEGGAFYIMLRPPVEFEPSIEVIMRIENETPSFTVAGEAYANIPLNTDTHVALTFDPAVAGGPVRMFVGGQFVAGIERLQDVFGATANAVLTIGGWELRSSSLKGSVKMVKITKKVIYTENFTPSPDL